MIDSYRVPLLLYHCSLAHNDLRLCFVLNQNVG
jgi:hypothetical protein